MPEPQIQTRDDLIYALTLAAELEHSLSCQYLYAAYALKTSREEGLSWEHVAHVAEWKKTLLEIARQEMEHLGLANNLLTSVGGAPHFRRPNFPQAENTYGGVPPARLEGVSLESLERFIEYEKPAPFVVPVDLTYDGIHGLYRLIREAFETLPEDALFIGPPEAQVDNESLHGEPVVRAYDVILFKVVDRETALKAVDLIMEEGEGAPSEAETDPHSHYARLVEMHRQLAEALDVDPSFNPSREVVSNPTTRERHREAPGATLITHPLSREIADLFGTAYETMLFALYRFYARTDETEEELFGLQRTAFFPLMTVILRPLAEMLTALPAFEEESPERAGPPFEFYRSVQLLPRKESAWVVIAERLDEMAEASREIAERPDSPERMRLTSENLHRVAANFKAYMGLPASD